ncbi:hypothetical protein CcCBS67573_g04629 [Chytriomyces confervae]|uniref:Uncharacterized protein n=1 Tax=Chytriomyces confervae TaxID=246404 RepID=A0A507FCP1_9FUNG|nr:hypothetical protein HDU80_011561 [Chytriomyces hyalinus]TPX74111.1 hypothetical protein CcCBS67573_g04629 [Chytriomyces confervae]
MNLDHLKGELDEFESFVDSYAKQMDDIINGRIDPVDAANAEPMAENTTREMDENSKVPYVPTADAKRGLDAALMNVLPKVPKTSLDYSRFENIDDDLEEAEEISPKPAPTTATSANNTSSKTNAKDPKPALPYSLKSNTSGKSFAEKIADLANKSKTLGNEAIRVQDAHSAIKHYSEAIDTCLHPTRDQLNRYDSLNRAKANTPSTDPFEFLDKLRLPDPDPITPDPALFTNRAYARLCVKDYAGAVEDCAIVIHSQKLNPQLDKSILCKAFWRSGHARLALNDTLAVDDFEAVFQSIQNTAKAEKSNATPKALPVTLEDAERMLRISKTRKRLIENDLELLDNSNKPVSDQRDSFKEFQKSFIHSLQRNVSEAGAHSKPGSIAMIDSKQMSNDVSSICALLNGSDHTSAPATDAFRLNGGFDQLFGDDTQNQTAAVCPNSAPLVLPIILTALMKNEHNRTELGKRDRLTRLVKASLECPWVFSTTRVDLDVKADGKKTTTTVGLKLITETADIVSACLSNETCAQDVIFWIRTDKGTSETWKQYLKTAFLLLSPPTSVNSETSREDARAHTQLPAIPPSSACSLLQSITSLLSFGSIGAQTLFTQLKCNPEDLLNSCKSVLGSLFETKQPSVNSAKNTGLIAATVTDCVFALVRCATKAKPANARLSFALGAIRDEIIGLFAKCIRDQELVEKHRDVVDNILACIHNWLIVCQKPFNDSALVSMDLVPTLIRCLGAKNRSAGNIRSCGVTLALLAKLLARNPKQVSRDIDGWWDELEISSRLEEFLDLAEKNDVDFETNGFNDVGNWLQILTGWLQQGQDEQEQVRVVQSWREEGGFDILVRMVKCFSRLPAVAKSLESVDFLEQFHRTAGNLGLAMAECLKKAEFAKVFHAAGATDPLVQVLRFAVDKAGGKHGADKNLSIACARICQNDAAKDRVKELKGIELMYCVGTKIG